MFNGYNHRMPTLPFLPPARRISDTAQLQALVKTLTCLPCVAVDTESNSLHAYHERICLIQLSDKDSDYLIDPLIGFDLAPLGDLLVDERIEKVFHAAEYDVLCLRRDFGFQVRNIFDSMAAARVLGLPNLGLGALLKERFGLEIPKRFQKADWARRPLPDDMAQYAQTDTHYLLALKAQLEAELQGKGLLPLAREDFTRLETALVPLNGQPLYAAVHGQHELNSAQRAVLNELCIYRDGIARKLDKPLFKVLPDAALLAIARLQPHDYADLRQVQDLPHSLAERHASGLLKAVERGRRADPIPLPRHPRPDDAYLARLEALKTWRKKEAAAMGVLSDVIMPRDVIEAIARHNPLTINALEAHMESVPVRRERFSGSILTALKGVL